MEKALWRPPRHPIMGAAQCADLLHTTAINHQNADQQSAINNSTAPAFPPGAKPTFLVPAIPSAEGGHSDVPGWWHTIEAYVEGEMWPNGHQDKLNAAADAWRTAAQGLRSAADNANGFVIAAIRAQKSPEFPAAADISKKDRDSFATVADGFDAAAKACADYAHAIDDAHSKFCKRWSLLGATVAVTEVLAAVLIPFTAGGSEASLKSRRRSAADRNRGANCQHYPYFSSGRRSQRHFRFRCSRCRRSSRWRARTAAWLPRATLPHRVNHRLARSRRARLAIASLRQGENQGSRRKCGQDPGWHCGTSAPPTETC